MKALPPQSGHVSNFRGLNVVRSNRRNGLIQVADSCLSFELRVIGRMAIAVPNPDWVPEDTSRTRKATGERMVGGRAFSSEEERYSVPDREGGRHTRSPGHHAGTLRGALVEAVDRQHVGRRGAKLGADVDRRCIRAEPQRDNSLLCGGAQSDASAARCSYTPRIVSSSGDDRVSD